VAAAESWTYQMNADTHYAIDRAASQFTVQVFSGGLLSAFGHSPTIVIRDFSGEARLNPNEPQHSSLRMLIKADSLTVRDDISDKDRREMERIMREEILETAQYPEIIYECSNLSAANIGDGQYSATLNGQLKLHGATHNQVVPARVSVTEDVLRAFGSFSLLQSDYGLKLASVAAGALKVKDELKFSFNIMARKKA
jgi:polyisoprenoid-binding protein YceI